MKTDSVFDLVLALIIILGVLFLLEIVFAIIAFLIPVLAAICVVAVLFGIGKAIWRFLFQ